MARLFAVADPEGVIEASAYDIGVKLAAVGLVCFTLQGISEAEVRHAFKLGHCRAVSLQGRYPIGVAVDFDAVNHYVEFFFLPAPFFGAVLPELFLQPLIHPLAFFQDHEDSCRHRLRFECRREALVSEGPGASAAVGEAKGVTRGFFAKLSVVVDDFFNQH